MATEEREDERQFLEGLKARTGRDLAEWMAALAAQGFADKNETIDWLREQGLPFARASWLERIHRNGGKPIYSDPPARRSNPPSPRTPEGPGDGEPKGAPIAAADQQLAPRERAPPTPPPAVGTADDAAAIDQLVAAAKGYRPLYHLLEDEMRKVIPALAIIPASGYLSIRGPAEFAAVSLGATEVRLGLDLGNRPFDPLLQKAKMKGPGAAISHMAVLTDARQINEELLAAIKAANSRVNG